MSETSGHDVDRLIAGCVASHDALVAHLHGTASQDPAAPSRLPGWTVGHVLTHIARNADSQVSMLDGHPQYPHGVDGRNADIERGAGRSWSELLADVTTTNVVLEQRWSKQRDWSGTSESIGGQRPTDLLPFLRQREVEIHRTDLGLGYEFEDMPGEYVRRELRMLEMQWRARRPMGMTGLPEQARAAPPSARLAWLAGRTEIEGIGPAALF